MMHELKIIPKYFEAIRKGEKTFEVRKNDRCFNVGDYLAMNEFDKDKESYTGQRLLLKITYVLDDEDFCKKGYVILGLSKSISKDEGIYFGPAVSTLIPLSNPIDHDSILVGWVKANQYSGATICELLFFR